MIQANEFMCLSTGPGHRKDNARLFKMFTNLDKSKGGILSGLLFNESNNEIEIAFFETQAGTDGENSGVPLIYSTGSKTNDRTWCRLVQDLFPDEAEIDQTIMKRPQIDECVPIDELNELPEQNEETGNDRNELSEQDMETRDLN